MRKQMPRLFDKLRFPRYHQVLAALEAETGGQR